MANFNKIPIGYKNEAHLPKRNGIYLGMVRKNLDGQRMGRLLVWVSDFGPDNEDFWLPLSYASPFAGATPVRDLVKDGKSAADSQKSYGFWATPPDYDNQILCCFLDGDIGRGYWFSCVYPQHMDHMVPGIGWATSTDSQLNQEFDPYGPPCVEYNKYDDSVAPIHSDFSSGITTTAQAKQDNVTRPPFLPLAQGLLAQGLASDPERGISNTSARRESPSRAYGLLSPRGNSIHIDDGPVIGTENEFIRIRTRSGTQILVHETSGYIYMNTKNGNSWVEISDAGIDMYSAGPISLSSDSDINLNAGGSVGIFGQAGIHLSTPGTLSTFSTGDIDIYTAGNANLQTGNTLGIKSGANIAFEAVQNFTTKTGGDTDIYVGGTANFHAVTAFKVKSDANISFDAAQDYSTKAGGNIIEGAAGYASRKAPSVFDTPQATSGGGSDPQAVTAVAPTAVDDAAQISEVNSRVPEHEPYNHPVGNADGAHGSGDITGSGDSGDVDSTGAGSPGADTTGRFTPGGGRGGPASHKITGVDKNGNPTINTVDSEGRLVAKPAHIPASAKEKAKLLYKKLKARGYSDIQIAAILGVWEQESSLNSWSQEPAPKGGGFYGKGIGLAQWSINRGGGGGRKQTFLNYAAAHKKPWEDVDTQLDFFDLELKTTEKAAGKKLKAATTLQQALDAMRQYERFGTKGSRDERAEAYNQQIQSGAFA